MKFENYEFKTKPYDHQLSVLKDSWAAEYYALFMEMGTGKSKVAIDTMGMLYEEGHIDAALIVAPKGVYDNWVRKEIEAHLPERIERTVVRWMPSSAKGYQEEELSKKSKYRRVLTGSPITKSPMDLFSQCAFLSPKALNIPSFYAYQNRYAVVQKRTMGHRSFNEITGYRRLDELNAKLDRFSNRVLKVDCLDLPEKIYMQRLVNLTDAQNSAYVQMQKLALAKLESGELSTTASVLTQIMRLQQICCGHLPDDDGNLHPYTHDLKAIKSELDKQYGEASSAIYFGETAQDERQEIVNKFQDPDSELRFFIGQPRTGGYGITLTAANTMVYYNNSYDLEIRLQSEDRIHRIGQGANCTYIDLITPGTIDEKILQALRSKIDIAGQVLGEDVKTWLI